MSHISLKISAAIFITYKDKIIPLRLFVSTVGLHLHFNDVVVFKLFYSYICICILYFYMYIMS